MVCIKKLKIVIFILTVLLSKLVQAGSFYALGVGYTDESDGVHYYGEFHRTFKISSIDIGPQLFVSSDIDEPAINSVNLSSTHYYAGLGLLVGVSSKKHSLLLGIGKLDRGVSVVVNSKDKKLSTRSTYYTVSYKYLFNDSFYIFNNINILSQVQQTQNIESQQVNFNYDEAYVPYIGIGLHL